MSDQTGTPTPKNAGRRPNKSRRPPPQATGTNHKGISENEAAARSSVAGHTSDGAAYGSPRKQSRAPTTPSASRKRNARGNNQNIHKAPPQDYNSDSGVTQQKPYSPARLVSHSIDMSNGMPAYTGPGAAQLAADTNNSYMRSPPNVRTPAKQVYAGPNFLSSPAPSSLPMPRAFSKSVPSVAVRDQVQLSQEEEEDEEEEEEAGTPAPPNPITTVQSQSPLDFFFNADRAERSRQVSHSESPLAGPRPNAGVLDNNGRSQSLPQAIPSQDNARNLVNGSPGNRGFASTIDGLAERHDERQFPPTPSYQQRMDSLRRPPSHTPNSRPVTQDDDLQRQAKTRALKQMLMSPSEERAEPALPTNPSPAHHSQRSPQQSADNATDIRQMEDHLRRVLKLGP